MTDIDRSQPQPRDIDLDGTAWRGAPARAWGYRQNPSIHLWVPMSAGAPDPCESCAHEIATGWPMMAAYFTQGASGPWLFHPACAVYVAWVALIDPANEQERHPLLGAHLAPASTWPDMSDAWDRGVVSGLPPRGQP